MFQIPKNMKSFYESLHTNIERISTKQLMQPPEEFKKQSVAFFPIFICLFIVAGILRVVIDSYSMLDMFFSLFYESMIVILASIIITLAIQVTRVYIIYVLMRNFAGIVRQHKKPFITTLHAVFMFGCVCILSGQIISGITILFIVTPWLYMIKSYFK